MQYWPTDRVERWSLDRLVPFARNARTHSARQVDQIAASMREWGWTNPVLVDEAGTIIAGHGRVEAARKLGLTEAPVMVACGWSEAKKRAYVIADNKLALNAGWNEEMLAAELSDLKDMAIDLELVGFDPPELERLLGSGESVDGEDDVPAVPGTPVSRSGDLWLLGQHRLLCGDSTAAADVSRLLGGVRPGLMVTDPPYGVDYDLPGGTAPARARPSARARCSTMIVPTGGRPGRCSRAMSCTSGTERFTLPPWPKALWPAGSTSEARSSGQRSGWC
jgi:hypothetical protein